MVTKGTTKHNEHKEKNVFYGIFHNGTNLVLFVILRARCDLRLSAASIGHRSMHKQVYPCAQLHPKCIICEMLKTIQNSFYSVFHKNCVKI